MPSSSVHKAPSTGLRLAPPPRENPLSRLAARLRFSAALKSPEPPADASLLSLYVEALQDPALDTSTRAKLCRAITYIDGSAGRYVESWIPLYIEAACAFSDDPWCVLFVLSLLHSGAIDPRADLPFSQGVYAAALFFEVWEGDVPHASFGLPAYTELSRELASLYAADANRIAPDRTAFVEKVYAQLEQRTDIGHWENERAELAVYLARAYRVEGRDDIPAQKLQERISRWRAAPAPEKQKEWNDDPLDDPEVILRGGSGNPEDDQRIAHRYIEEERDFDAAACALFARCIRYAKAGSNQAESVFWTVKLARALIAVGRVDEDAREIFQDAAATEPDDSLLELAYLYTYAKGGAHQQISGDPDLANRFENAVLTQSSRFAPIADQQHWDWQAMERCLALVWGHRGRTDAYARTLYKRVTDANPEDALLAVLYARALAQANITDNAAIRAYEIVVELGKANESVRRALAIAYAKAGVASGDEKRPQAMRLWEEMHRSGMSEDMDVAAALADAYSREGKGNDVAIAVWGKVAKADPKNGQIRLRLARELRDRGEELEATKLFKEAAKLLPEDFEAQYEAGLSLRARNDEAGAIRFLKKAVVLPAGAIHKEAHFALGDALLAVEKRDEAVQAFEKILNELDPDHSPTLLRMAKLSLRYEETGAKRAEQLYGKALALDSSNPEGYKRLALLHEEQGRFADAEVAWEQYLALSPPDGESTRKIADLYLKRGDFVKAESALRQTVALGGGDKKLFSLLGEVIVQAQKQRDGETATPLTDTSQEPEEQTSSAKTRRIAPRPAVGAVPSSQAAAEETTNVVTKPVDTGSPVRVAPSVHRRQTLVTQSSITPDSPPNPDSPTSQNLTRSVGAAAIKAALRNRAARLSQAAPENDGEE
ncbi:MAG: tetratricopeptide repeat protein [Akkermansiaceae bacterium]|nr:tetratricopeptide repeat protein [Armatimonadota bacterium]